MHISSNIIWLSFPLKMHLRDSILMHWIKIPMKLASCITLLVRTPSVQFPNLFPDTMTEDDSSAWTSWGIQTEFQAPGFDLTQSFESCCNHFESQTLDGRSLPHCASLSLSLWLPNDSFKKCPFCQYFKIQSSHNHALSVKVIWDWHVWFLRRDTNFSKEFMHEGIQYY